MEGRSAVIIALDSSTLLGKLISSDFTPPPLPFAMFPLRAGLPPLPLRLPVFHLSG